MGHILNGAGEHRYHNGHDDITDKAPRCQKHVVFGMTATMTPLMVSLLPKSCTSDNDCRDFTDSIGIDVSDDNADGHDGGEESM